MALLGASVLAILVGVGIIALLGARLWMRIVFRLATIVLTLAAFAAVGAVIWLWVAR